MSEKRMLKALVIEDDPFSVAILKHYGSKLDNFILELYHTVSLEESLEFMEKHPEIELIFLDYRVHSTITGLEILQHIRARGINVPVIIVTGSGSEEVAVSMMKAGASDYLVKGRLNPDVLNKAIKDSLEKHVSINSILASQNNSILKDMAISASLNGLCTIDDGGKITYVNPSFMNMWGYGRNDEIIGSMFKDLLNNPKEYSEITSMLKDKKSWLGELLCKRKDKGDLYVQALFSLLKLKDKNNACVMGSFIDITRIKNIEKKKESLYKGIMEVFALKAEDVGNVETAGHIHRIAAYTRFIAFKLRELDDFKDYIDEKYINDVSYASMLHDVGKWRTPNEILLKPYELTDPERKIIQQHPLLGAEMLSPLLKDKGSSQYLRLVESVVLYHHERWDGKGYPKNLKGKDIPLSARIVALADIYDALTSDRSYRKALSHEEAFKVMEEEKERFDPRIWDVFKNSHMKFKKIREEIE